VSHRFRPAEERDRAAVFAVCARTWPDGDYIPRVWDAWLADPLGILAVGVDAGDQAVAVGKLSVPAPGEGWLEGLRVAPALRQGGWGRALAAYLTASAWAQGLHTVRYITEARNTPMHRVAAALGFAHEGETHPYRVDVGSENAGRLDTPGGATARLAESAETAGLWEVTVAAWAPGPPLRWHRWTAATASAAWFAAAVDAGQVLVAADGRSLAVLTPPGSDESADVALVAAAPAARAELLAAARGWAVDACGGRVLAMLPPFAAAAADADGWTAITERPMSLYGRSRPDAVGG
jgi:RimJ/RimL family protein N-acetyltransferase